MKSITYLILLFIGVCAAQELSTSPVSPRIFENVVNATFEKIREMLTFFDPFYLANATFELEGHKYEVQNVYLYGISNWRLENVRVDFFISYWFHADIVIPSAGYSVGNYSIEGPKAYGHGSSSFSLTDFRTYLKFRFDPLFFVISEVEVRPSVGNAKYEITGMYDDEEFSKRLSENISRMLNQTLNADKELQKKFAELVRKIVQKILDIIKGRGL